MKVKVRESVFSPISEKSSSLFRKKGGKVPETNGHTHFSARFRLEVTERRHGSDSASGES